jgi:Protein of unknown function (DUF664)
MSKHSRDNFPASNTESKASSNLHRRSFLRASASTALAAGSAALLGGASSLVMPTVAHAADDPQLSILGPRAGYTPQIGTFVSELTWMRDGNGILAATKGLTQADLDYLVDPNSNTIGALMLHLAATEVYYGLNTFDGMEWGKWSDDVKKQWEPAMNLGKAGRDTIKGHDRDYYVKILADVRVKTLANFKKKDDAWFLGGVEDWFGPTNTFCKWFHVCEHEAHHSGQVAYLRKRLPGAKPAAE